MGNVAGGCSAVVLAGSSLGLCDYTSGVRVAGSAGEATEWMSLTSLWARVAYGAGFLLPVTVSLQMHVATTSRFLSFDTVFVAHGHALHTESSRAGAAGAEAEASAIVSRLDACLLLSVMSLMMSVTSLSYF